MFPVPDDWNSFVTLNNVFVRSYSTAICSSLSWRYSVLQRGEGLRGGEMRREERNRIRDEEESGEEMMRRRDKKEEVEEEEEE